MTSKRQAMRWREAYHINVGRGTMTWCELERCVRIAYHINVGRGTMTALGHL